MEGIVGLVGVALGAVIGWVGEWWRARQSRADRAYYLAVRVTLVLDEYIGECFGIALYDEWWDEGTVPSDFPLPDAPNLPDDVDWKSIDRKLMYEILALPRKIAKRYEAIRHPMIIVKGERDDDEIIEDIKAECSSLGLKIVDITEQLRDRYIRGRNEIPEGEDNRDDVPTLRKCFEETITRMREKRKKRYGVWSNEVQQRTKEDSPRRSDNEEKKG